MGSASSAPLGVYDVVEWVDGREVHPPSPKGIRWRPTSESELRHVARAMMRDLPSSIDVKESDVPVGGKQFIRTIRLSPVPPSDDPADPLVVLHGFGGGSALWRANIDTFLGGRREVYLVDLPGFGGSSRHPFTGREPREAEDYFVLPLEKWRHAVVRGTMTLLGHSFGAYISSCYALRNPDHVSKLILVDPWGVSERTEADVERQQRFPLKFRVAACLVSVCSPLSLLRAAGPWGPDILTKIRADLAMKWSGLYSDDGLVASYLYHCNAQSPASGEEAFMALQIPYAFAAQPLIKRMHELSENIDLHVIYGSHTWMDITAGREMAAQHRGRNTVSVIPASGHHVYIDNADHFNGELALILAS